MAAGEQELLRAWCDGGDREARRRLIEMNLPLVRVLAQRFAYSGEQLEDLTQVGAVGLIKAVDRYDPDRGVALDAYAATVIAGEIRHHLRDRCAPVRVPRRLQAEGVRVTAVQLDHEAGGPQPDPAEEADDRVAVGAALRALAPRERRLVLLRFVEDLSQAQIARRTGLSQVHVSRTLRGALLRLHEQLAAPSTNG
jgi:RNA polymerase sigma-B factor